MDNINIVQNVQFFNSFLLTLKYLFDSHNKFKMKEVRYMFSVLLVMPNKNKNLLVFNDISERFKYNNNIRF